MSDTAQQTAPDADPVPEYPMPRTQGCPLDPPAGLYDLQQSGPMRRVRLWDGATPWLVTRYDEQRAVLSDPRVSADVTKPGHPSPARPANGGSKVGFILMDDPEHARLRRMVTAPFTVKRVAAMRPAVQRIVDGLIDDMLAGPAPTDLVEAFALPVPSLVICELLGVPYADHEFFQSHSKVIVRRDATMEERSEALEGLGAYLHGLVGQKIAAPQDDLLSGLAARVTAGELAQQEAAQIGVLLLIAGHETTANMIALGTYTLFQHPEQLARLRDEDDPALVNRAVEELLRYLNITHNGRRRVALEDMEVAGQQVRAGEGLILPNDIANRDSAAFADPDRLDLDRDARHHVAFGFGVHQCLGQSLARMELSVVYSTLYRRIPGLRLARDADEVPFKSDGQVYGVYELPVTW